LKPTAFQKLTQFARVIKSSALSKKWCGKYEAGVSIYSLVQKYGIGAQQTVKRRIEKYSYAGYRKELVMTQTLLVFGGGRLSAGAALDYAKPA